jgi:rhamnogalacturonyl hydrolase YesR
MNKYLMRLLVSSLLFCCNVLRVNALTAVDDSTVTLPNTPVVIVALTNDFVSASNSTAILRVTQPAQGRVIINSTPVTVAELTPLFQFAAVQLSNTAAQVANTNLYPWVTLTNGSWETAPAGDNNWISGFFPGALWHVYEQTGDANFRNWAESWMASIAPMQFSTNVDDVGFMINTSFGTGYLLTSNANFKAVLLQAAQSLSTRFNTVVGCLADDRLLTPPPFETILDTMMNSELLFRAYDLGGNTNFYNMALSHAEKTMLNNVRADGSTYHRVVYDANTGAVLSKGTRAGASDESTWARGHAWAIYGFTMAYRETRDARFLNTAQRVADYYINNVPSDYVPYWDFQAPGIPNALKDSSAAAITLSALLELSQLATNSNDGAKYWQAARHIFNSLSSTNYLAQGTPSSGILLHGNSVDAQTDASLIYGDYYFIEALKRLNDFYSHTTLTYIPDTNFSGSDTFSYQVCDSSGASSTATVNVTVGILTQISISPLTQAPTISFPTLAGKNYFVQYLDSLAPNASWNVLATNVSGSGAVISITDTNPPAKRFYRVGAD